MSLWAFIKHSHFKSLAISLVRNLIFFACHENKKIISFQLFSELVRIGPLQAPVIWYAINYIGTQITQWDFQNKGKSGWTVKSSFVLEVPLCYLRPSIIYSVPRDRILQRAYCVITNSPFPSSPKLLHQSEAWCTTIHMKIKFACE